MSIQLVNRQTGQPVPLRRLARVAARAVRRLRLRVRGTLAVTFVDDRTMQRINRRFLRHRGLTDVVSFRYDGEPIAGEILVAPAAARRYARAHGLTYADELARYVVHGLLHWAGHDDRTAAQQRRMRKLEDRLLTP
ncbi:MAG: rRNA maturation RNase YbeY [Candidatus Omnitrophica bacterium]|nr:rRNA maturation RNase YbeY [Candidatus Omnitrophota bacterium]